MQLSSTLSSTVDPAQLVAYRFEIQLGGAALGDDRIICVRSQKMLVPTEIFSDQSLYPVPLDGTTYFSTYGQAQTSRLMVGGSYIDQKMPRVDFMPAGAGAQIFASMPQTARGWKSLSSLNHHHPYLTGMVTARFLRPRERRLFRAACPPLLCILLRNPWVRFRRIRLG